MKLPSQKTIRLILILALGYAVGKLLLPYLTPRNELYGSLEHDTLHELRLERFESRIILSSAGDGLVQESLLFLADQDLTNIPFNRSFTLQIPSVAGARDLDYQGISVARIGTTGDRTEIAITTKLQDRSIEINPINPNTEFFAKGKNQFQLSYTIKNVLESDSHRRLFVWNILSRHFLIETKTLTGSIAFPRGVKREFVEIRSMVYGMNEAGSAARIEKFLAGQSDNFLIVNSTQPLSADENEFISFYAPRPLVPGELVLVSADWPTAAEPEQSKTEVIDDSKNL